MRFTGNNLKDALALLEECVSGKIGIEEFARDYFDLTEGGFSVIAHLPSTVSNQDDLEEAFSALRSDCAQFQPDPDLHAELMKSAAYPGEFLNQSGLRERVEKIVGKLKDAGVYSTT